ncbi:SDR family NAD(P)-dependent oxidoreductase [Thermostaphylospora chromogena]|uniref:SDR family NAD(P)-dependent oxidoreductase n=1 Tax=Thermostaphylospora chromogena TaxID=35622 RepID=UPI000B847815|nr:SDR family NAD(P)-dependent oxidoreductase [Thermostaphylospora chromogena]
MDLQLSGRVAVVTGASKGIGLAVTRTFLEEGARVVAASRRSTPELDALARPEPVHVPVDLMDAEAPGRVVARAVRRPAGGRRRGRPAGLPALGLHDRRSSSWTAAASRQCDGHTSGPTTG